MVRLALAPVLELVDAEQDEGQPSPDVAAGPGSAAISVVNAGVEAFARAAALEAPNGVRVNVVSPPWVSETLEAMGQDGAAGIPAARLAAAYVDSVEGTFTGKVIDARTYK